MPRTSAVKLFRFLLLVSLLLASCGRAPTAAPPTATFPAPTQPAVPTRTSTPAAPTATAAVAATLSPEAPKPFTRDDASGQWRLKLDMGDDPIRAAVMSKQGLTEDTVLYDQILLVRGARIQMLEFTSLTKTIRELWSRERVPAGQQPALDHQVKAALAPEGGLAAVAASAAAFAAGGDAAGSAAAGAGEAAIRLYDSATGADRAALAGFTTPVRDMAFSPDGRRLAAATGDRFVPIWDTASGGPPRKIELPAAWANCLAFSPDGKTLAVGFFDTVLLFDVESGAQLAALRGHTDAVNSLAFEPMRGGRYLVSGGADGVIIQWDTLSDPPSAVWVTPAQGRPVTRLFYPQTGGQILYSIDADGVVQTWAMDNGTQSIAYLPAWQLREGAGEPDATQTGAALNPTAAWVGRAWFGTFETALLYIYPDGAFLIDVMQTGQGYRFHLARRPAAVSRDALLSENSGTYPFLSADGKRMATIAWDGVEIRELAANQVVRQLKSTSLFREPYPVQFFPEMAVLSPDFSLLAVTLNPGAALVDSTSGQVHAMNKIPLDGAALVESPPEALLIDLNTGQDLLRWKGYTSALAFSTDGKRLALATPAGLMIHDLEAGSTRDLLAWNEESTLTQRMAFSPDGSRIALGTTTGQVLVVDAESGTILWQTANGAGPVTGLVYAPDGKTLAYLSNGDVVLLDAATGQIIHAGQFDPAEPVSALAFTADGSRLAAATSSAVMEWTLANGQNVSEVALATLGVEASQSISALAHSQSGAELLVGLGYGAVAGYNDWTAPIKDIPLPAGKTTPLDAWRTAVDAEPALPPAAPAPVIDGPSGGENFQVVIPHRGDGAPWLYSSQQGSAAQIGEPGVKIGAWSVSPAGDWLAYAIENNDPEAAQPCALKIAFVPLVSGRMRTVGTNNHCIHALAWQDETRLLAFTSAVIADPQGKIPAEFSSTCNTVIQEFSVTGQGRVVYQGRECTLGGQPIGKDAFALNIRKEFYSEYRAVLDLKTGKTTSLRPVDQLFLSPDGKLWLACSMKNEYNGEGHCPATLLDPQNGRMWRLQEQISEANQQEWSTFRGWSPDGRLLLFHHIWGGFNLGGIQQARIDLIDRGGNARAFTPRYGQAVFTALWAPDARSVTFAQCDVQPESGAGQNCVLLNRALDGAVTRLASLPAPAYSLAWARTGGRLLLNLYFNDHMELWSIRADGSDLRKEVETE